VFFWSERGYFDTDAAFKPLLHTWSLSVEEQFYLILPWLIIFIPRDRLVQFVLPAIVVSFALRELMMSHADLHTAAYVLTPTNLAPLFAGVIAAWLVPYHDWRLPSLNGGLFLGWIGRRSYALYLFHLPTAHLAVTLMGHSQIAVASALLFLAMVVHILYVLVERPILGYARERWHYGAGRRNAPVAG